jgi:hypothetical protein
MAPTIALSDSSVLTVLEAQSETKHQQDSSSKRKERAAKHVAEEQRGESKADTGAATGPV